MRPEFLIVHFTAGRSAESSVESFSSPLATLTDTAGKLDGYYIQYVTLIAGKKISSQKTSFVGCSMPRITLSKLFRSQ